MAGANSVTAALATLGGAGWTINAPTPYVGGTLAAPYTWAGKPAATAVPVGTIIRITDFGVPFLLMMSDGTRWVPAGPQILGRAGAAATTTGDTNENTLATVTVPAGAMGINGGLEIRTVWTLTNSANAKTTRVRLGGIGGTMFLNPAFTAVVSFSDVRRIRNRASAASQIGSYPSALGGIGSNTSALPTGVIDTTVNQDIVITGQNGLAAESIALETMEVWLLP